MGKLCTLKEIQEVIDWYLPDTGYGVSRWPSTAFPYVVTIHHDTLYLEHDKRIEIRKWIEAVLPATTVVRTIIDKSYKRYYRPRKKYDEGSTQDNKWHAFYFEDEHSALMFRLRFADWVQNMSEKHPGDDDKPRPGEEDMPELYPAYRSPEH